MYPKAFAYRGWNEQGICNAGITRSSYSINVITPKRETQMFKLTWQSCYHSVICRSMAAKQTYSYPIRSYHTDAHGRLFIHQLLNFFQDAAHNHADGLGFGQKQLVEDNLFWVLSRLSIEIIELPKVGDELVLTTWVKSIRGSVSEREFSISINNKISVNSSSLWFCLSAENHKPTRLPPAYSSLMATHNAHATDAGTQKVLVRDTGNQFTAGAITQATYTDIDMANHVNNAAYVRWLMDEISADYHQHKRLKKLVVNYLGECFLGEKVLSQYVPITDDDLMHEIQIADSDKVILRAQSQWQ